MRFLRRKLIAHPALAAALLAATLLLRVLVPAGYMADLSTDHFTIELCSGYGPQTMAMAMPMPSHSDKKGDHGKAEMPCGFSGLSAAMTGVADPIQLAALVAFVMAIGCAAVLRRAPSGLTFLRPPLRGPPARL